MLARRPVTKPATKLYHQAFPWHNTELIFKLNHKLVFLKEKEKKAMQEKIANVKIGSVMKATVESLQNYGAFIRLEDGLSGLVHVSQISQKRVKAPKDVLKEGEEVKVKIIGIKDGKISLSMKA